MSIILKKAAVLKAEPIGNDGCDPIVTFASQMEKIESRVKTEEIIRNLTEESEANKYKIGGALARLQANENWWQDAGYQNFKDYVEGSLGIGYRKAMYMIEFYKTLLELDVPWVKLGGIGWGKINRIVSVLTKENIDEWVEKAKGMNRPELEAHIKAEKQKNKTGKEHEPKTITTKTFKLHDDQKQLVADGLKKASEETGSAVEAVNLEAVFQNYLGSGLMFSDAKQALTYARKHSDNPAQFVETWIAVIKELCPELTINAEITLKGEAAAA
jgi:hypothetical protein